MKTLSRYVSLACASACLVMLTNCSSVPQSTTSPASSPSPVVSTPHSTTHSSEAKININTAILSELDKLEAKLGIPALSNKIQAARPYGSPEDLVSKKVLTPEQFEQVKDQVTIEDIVLTGEAKDIDYMIKLGLMKGHMIVAQELLAANEPKQAEPHIGHPVEEIYVDVEEQLAERNVSEFKTKLMNLQNLVKSQPQDAKVPTQFKESLQAIDNAIAALPENQRQSPDFVLPVINGLLDTAATEYSAAVANGKITAIIEYQDAHGFITYANSLYESISPEAAKVDAQSDRQIKDSMAQLTAAFKSAIAPQTPVKTPEEVRQLVQTIAQTHQKLTTK